MKFRQPYWSLRFKAVCKKMFLIQGTFSASNINQNDVNKHFSGGTNYEP